MRSKSGKSAALYMARLAILAVSIGFIIIGIQRGEVSVVLKKAVNICLECIGLG